MKTFFPPFVHSYPAPAVLIGCGSVEKPNLITCSWFGTVSSDPPQVGVSIRPSRHSYSLVRQSGEFTVNLPRTAEVQALRVCGSISGRDHDKFRELKLTAVPCPPLETAPMIDEFFMALACRVKHELDLGTHHLFIAEVVGVYGEQGSFGHSSRPEVCCEQQIVYLDGKYWSLAPTDKM